MRRQQLWLTWKSERGDGGARDGSARRAATVERRTPAASVVALRVRVRVRARRPRVARPPRLMVAAGEHDAVVRTVSIWLGLLRVTPFFFFFFFEKCFYSFTAASDRILPSQIRRHVAAAIRSCPRSVRSPWPEQADATRNGTSEPSPPLLRRKLLRSPLPEQHQQPPPIDRTTHTTPRR
jgi:hypothetical protein